MSVIERGRLAGGLRLEQALWPERRELVCAGCGYGVVVAREPPRCPMCHGSSWRPLGRTAPLGRASELDPIAV
jgi:rubrerythrin